MMTAFWCLQVNGDHSEGRVPAALAAAAPAQAGTRDPAPTEAPVTAGRRARQHVRQRRCQAPRPGRQGPGAP